jgi:GntR family transcriptional regulator/MocR family aminotransferase
VIGAYEQLLVEGFLESKAGAGTHVAQALAKSQSFSMPEETLEPATHRRQLIDTLEALLPANLAWIEPGDQGMHLVLWLADGLDDREVVERAATEGVAVRAVSPMFAPRTGRPDLALGFGGFSSEQMKTAAQRLAAVIKGSRGGKTRRR